MIQVFNGPRLAVVAEAPQDLCPPGHRRPVWGIDSDRQWWLAAQVIDQEFDGDTHFVAWPMTDTVRRLARSVAALPDSTSAEALREHLRRECEAIAGDLS